MTYRFIKDADEQRATVSRTQKYFEFTLVGDQFTTALYDSGESRNSYDYYI